MGHLINGQPQSSTPEKRAHHEMVYDEKNKSILLTTGSTPLDGGKSFKFYNDRWHFSGDGWTKSADAGHERSGIRMAYDSKKGKIFSYGGYTGNGSEGVFCELSGVEWKVLSDLPEMKAAEGGLVYDADRDRFVAFGGSASRGIANNITWEWNGAEWKKFEGSGPEGRAAFAMIYDSKRKRSVLFGGMGASPQERFGDTWEFDGKTWMKISDNGPGPRISPGYAYDSKRGLLIIFGGMQNDATMGDTWGWNGKTWTKLADAGPSARVMGYMAYEKGRDRVVLFGGRAGWPNDLNDTWEWDGTQWREINRIERSCPVLKGDLLMTVPN